MKKDFKTARGAINRIPKIKICINTFVKVVRNNDNCKSNYDRAVFLLLLETFFFGKSRKKL